MRKSIRTLIGKYEILAILRDGLKKRSGAEVSIINYVYPVNFIDIDANGIYVNYNQFLASFVEVEHVFEVESMLGKISFCSSIKGTTLRKGVYSINYALPDEILIIERRRDSRVKVMDYYNFTLEINDLKGYKHNFIIKDISRNGCGLETEENIEIKAGSKLRCGLLKFGSFGNIFVDLVVVGIKKIKNNKDNSSEISHISCQFKIDQMKRKLIEDIIFDILMEVKRLKRIGKIKQNN